MLWLVWNNNKNKWVFDQSGENTHVLQLRLIKHALWLFPTIDLCMTLLYNYSLLLILLLTMTLWLFIPLLLPTMIVPYYDYDCSLPLLLSMTDCYCHDWSLLWLPWHDCSLLWPWLLYHDLYIRLPTMTALYGDCFQPWLISMVTVPYN